MNNYAAIRLRVANERAARLRLEASNHRLATANRAPIRRSIGHSIIRIGERLAAEPNRRPARTR